MTIYTKVKYSTYMWSAWWANQSSVHLLFVFDLLARGPMTVNITFTRYEKYVHDTVMYLPEKDLNIVSERKLPCPFSNFKI
jgi:hypothetical protein